MRHFKASNCNPSTIYSTSEQYFSSWGSILEPPGQSPGCRFGVPGSSKSMPRGLSILISDDFGIHFGTRKVAMRSRWKMTERREERGLIAAFSGSFLVSIVSPGIFSCICLCHNWYFCLRFRTHVYTKFLVKHSIFLVKYNNFFYFIFSLFFFPTKKQVPTWRTSF